MAGRIIVPPMDFENGNIVDNWKKWKQTVSLVFTGPLAGKREIEKCSFFLLYIGQTGRDIYNTWTLTDDEQDKIEPLFERFQRHCIPLVNVTILRYRFNTRNQNSSESFDQYYTELKTIAKDCAFGNIQDELIRDRIVCGINNKQVQERLLQEADLTLRKALEVARSYELSQAQMKEMSSETVHSVQRQPKARVHSMVRKVEEK